MTFGKVFGVLVVLSFAANGSAMARHMSAGTAGVKGKPAIAAKADKGTDKSVQASANIKHVKPQAPIVMGRSVSLIRNTKLHHVKIKPLDGIEAPVSADGSH